MNILKYILLFVLFTVFWKCYRSKENLITVTELKDLDSLGHATVDELVYLGLHQKRSKEFIRRIKKSLLEKIPPNSIIPGDKCVKDMHKLCKDDSRCVRIHPTERPVCSAGVDGINPVGKLSEGVNRYGNYDNGSINYFPIGNSGCANNINTLKCPPRYECHAKYNKCIPKAPLPQVFINIPKIDSTRLVFQPPMPIEPKLECPADTSYTEIKYAGFCKNNRTNELCALEPNKRNYIKFCSTVQCPDKYFQLEPGICEDNNGKKCSLEPDENYPLCGGHNDFLEIKNVNLLDNNIKSFKNITETECASKCQNNIKCDGFTIDDNNECFLKKNVTSTKKIQKKEGSILQLKTPINYSYHENTNLKGEPIKEFINKSYIDCAKECDKDSKCSAFTVGKDTDFSNCQLRDNIIGQSYYDKDRRTFRKKYKSGDLCNNLKYDNINDNISDTINHVNKVYDDKIETSIKKLKDEYKSELSNNTKKIYSDFINNYMHDYSMITWNIINKNCNRIIIKKLDYLYLHMSILQIWGIPETDDKSELIDYIQDKKTIINMSSIYNEHNSKYCRDNKLDTFMSTSYDEQSLISNSTNTGKNQYIEIQLPETIKLYKIIIFNKQGKNSDLLVPLKISLYNNDKYEHSATKESFNTPFKEADYLKLDDKLNVNDKGDLDKYHEILNIDETNSNYCRFTNNKSVKNNFNTIVCSGALSEYQYKFDNMNTPYKNTYFKNQNKETLNDDICRCTGIPENAKITCRDTKSNSDYVFKLFPHCNKLTSDEIKAQIVDNNNQCNISTKFKIDAGFYWNNTLSLYLFRNTIFNNKQVILYTLIDSETFKIRHGYPKIINNITWPGMSFLNKIDSVFRVSKDIVIFTRNNYFTKFNLIKKKQLPGYPKVIQAHFEKLPTLFSSKITAAFNIGNNMGLLFNGKKFIEYNLNMIENKGKYKSNIASIVRYDLKSKYSGIKLNDWDGIVYNDTLNYILFIIGNMYHLFDVKQNKVVTKTSMARQWQNLWKINVNNL